MAVKLTKFIKKYKITFISILITLFIEIFICNYGFFRTLITGNNNLKPTYIASENSVLILNIDSRITNIKFNYTNEPTDKITYKVSYTAEENSDTIELNEKVILKNNKHYINFDTHSKCKTIKIKLLTEDKNLQIESIILNKPTINISIIRIIIIFITIIFFSKIKNGSIYQQEYDKNSKTQDDRFKISILVFYSIIFIYMMCLKLPNNFFIEKENIDKEDSIIMQTEAIMNGQIHLLEEPSQELKEMENPYDNTKRNEEDIDYLFDTAYYNRKYYNYFGIAPILTSILPFRIITGRYTHTYIFNLVYILISLFALYSLYKKLINRYIKKISLCNFYLGYYTIIFASNIITLLRGQKYDIVITCGIAFLLISLNLVISIYNNKKYRYLKLILLGITTALIVLSKPTFIIYYILIAFLLSRSIKDLNNKEKIKNLLFVLIPLGIFAIFQMFLNYARFDNILEFGAQYQLTNFNMTSCMSITFGKIYAGIVEYLFRTPNINPLKFPFVFINTKNSLISINEICYENDLIGLISIPILYIYLLKGSILKKAKDKELTSFINICIITSIISIIINTCFGGICEVYSIEFKLILSIGAVILSLKWLENNQDNKDINKIFLIICIATIIIMVPISLTTSSNFLTNTTSDISAFLKNIFEFWA